MFWIEPWSQSWGSVLWVLKGLSISIFQDTPWGSIIYKKKNHFHRKIFIDFNAKTRL